MLDIEDALKAKRTLDDWLETNKASPLTPEEAETSEAILLSPAGKRATANLRDTLWIIRDLWRCGRGQVRPPNVGGGDGEVLQGLQEYRQGRGHWTTQEHLDTASAIIKSPIGFRAGANVPRLDAAVTLLFEVAPKKKEADQ